MIPGEQKGKHMVYTLGCIDIIIKRSALDKTPMKNSESLINLLGLKGDFYDQDLVCVAGGMNPIDAEDTGKWLEKEYGIQIIDESDPRHPIAKDGVVIDGPYGPTTECNWIEKCGHGWAFVHPIVNKNIAWNAERWSSRFKHASERRDRTVLHILREDVFRSTQEIVINGGYVINGEEIRISDPPKSIMFYKEIHDNESPAKPVKKKTIKVLSEDCLLTARRFADRNPIVLNMASRRNPGSGVEGGAGAQEECLFRSSNYYRTLYPMRDWYPMDRNFGGIYSPDVTVFRGLEDDGYPLLEEPFRTNFVAVAAISRPDLIGGVKYTLEDELVMKDKIRTILNIAARFGHKVLILSAFGCGAFRNPPHQVARLFKEILEEPTYNEIFEEVYFSIKPDHNDISGNCKAFREVFGE